MSLGKMSSNNKNFIFICVVFFVMINKIQNIYICQEDYTQTSYNLFCPSTNQIALVFRTSASFLSADAKRTDCIAQPSLILNASNTLTASLCNYCFSRQPCVLNTQLIDSNNMFSEASYKVGSKYIPVPISIGVFYQCIDKSKIGTMTQADLCADPSALTSTTTLPTRVTTGTTVTTTFRSTATTSCRCTCT